MQAERCHVNSGATEVQLRSNYLVHCLQGLCMHTQPTVDSIHFWKCGCLRSFFQITPTRLLLHPLKSSARRGQKTKEHKGSTVPLLPQHQERWPTPHRVRMHLSRRGGTISFHYGQAKPPALVTK
ncbi:uncharacterized protein ACIBXB_012507 [Morphnus guianensis]